ncbi:MAG: hypothetical protein ACRD8U_00915 [Pyrinomonadaceae bacterium]
MAVVLANPDARAVLQNLAASIVSAISVSGVKGIMSERQKPPFEVHPPLLRRRDPIDAGPNLTEALMAALMHRNGEPIELRIKHKSARQESEVIIKIG